MFIDLFDGGSLTCQRQLMRSTVTANLWSRLNAVYHQRNVHSGASNGKLVSGGSPSLAKRDVVHGSVPTTRWIRATEFSRGSFLGRGGLGENRYGLEHYSCGRSTRSESQIGARGAGSLVTRRFVARDHH